MIAKLRPGTIVLPWDFSHQCEEELQSAMNVVGDPAMIRSIHVAPSDTSGVALASDISYTKMRRDMERKFRQQTQGSRFSRDIPFYVAHGRVAAEIVSFAQRYDAGLIVMGTRKHWGITRFLRGSTTSEVVRLAHCPVLVLKGGTPAVQLKHFQNGQ